MSDFSSFSIQNPKQIISHLALVLKNNSLIRARFGVNNESYLTTLIGINEKNNVVILDYGPKEYLNRQILNADKVTFETEYKGIKVSFTGSALKKITYEDDQAFIMPIPKVLFWMERREYYRVKMPLSRPSYCQVILKDSEPVNIKLHGISLSGFSVLDDHKEIFNQMISGASFKQCKLILPDTHEEVISFDIRYSHIINPDKAQQLQKMGCMFTQLTHSAEDVIQRYMQRIQREDLQETTQNPEQVVRFRKVLIYLNYY